MTRRARLSAAAVNAEADALAALLDGGNVRFYDGQQPEVCGDSDRASVLLAEMKIANPAAEAATNGMLRLEMAESASAIETGRLSWFRVSAADGVPLIDGSIGDGSIGIENADLILPELMIRRGQALVIEAFTHTIPRNY